MMKRRSWMVLGTLVLIGLAACDEPGQPRGSAQASVKIHAVAAPPSLPADAITLTTAHYRIDSTATPAQTAQVAQAVERLHQSYIDTFPPTHAQDAKLSLVLYRNRAEFKRNNHSRPWAEAYYLPPRSYAYFDSSARNPYHWMLHEATHQLMREVSGFPRAQWAEEGLASYFGASRMVDGSLQLGDPDPSAYPIWWLSSYRLSGELEQDIAAGRFIPLEQLISGRGGPDENRYFNQYYIQYWSLTHFLFHYRNGMYAERYKRLIAQGGTLANFKRIIGPTERIEREWYAYLLQPLTAATQDGATQADAVVLYRQVPAR
jgi:hypothetical protein